MKFLIVEDDFSLSLELEMFLKSLNYPDTESVSNKADAISVLASKKVDFLIVDVNLDENLGGLDLVKNIEDKDIPVIFITALKDEEIFKQVILTNPSGFLIKPFDKITLQSCIDRVLRQKASQVNLFEDDESPILGESIFVKQNDKLKRVSFGDIHYIQADGNYIEIYLEHKRLVAKLSLTKVEQRMNVPYFIRVHKKFLVNINKIDQVKSVEEILIADKYIPVGAKYRPDLMDALNGLNT